MTEEPFSTHVMYSLVLLMMCRVSGLIAAGSFSSAWIKGISSPVSRFLIITLARISCFKKTHKFTFCVRKVREAVTKQMQGAGGRGGEAPALTSSVSSLPESERGRWGPGVCSPLWEDDCPSSFSYKRTTGATRFFTFLSN